MTRATLAKLFISACVILFLAGCAAPFKHRDLTINKLVMQNHTSATIRNVRVHAANTEAFAECSHIYANGEYSTAFQIKRYQGNPITVSWERDGKSNRTDEFYASTPDNIEKGKPATVRVIFNNDGSVFAALVQ